MDELQKTRRAAEIMSAYRHPKKSHEIVRRHYISVDDLKEAAAWRIACVLAEEGLSVECALEHFHAIRHN